MILVRLFQVVAELEVREIVIEVATVTVMETVVATIVETVVATVVETVAVTQLETTVVIVVELQVLVLGFIAYSLIEGIMEFTIVLESKPVALQVGVWHIIENYDKESFQYYQLYRVPR